jgi:hypothetical protein
MHEIESVAITQRAKVPRDVIHRGLGLKSHQRFEAEDGVIEIAFAGTVAEGSVRVGLAAHERFHKVA